MILVDTNVWITHLDDGDPNLARMLAESEVLVHPYVVGELALRGPSERSRILDELMLLPAIVVARHDEVLRLIAAHGIVGIGYVDAHLLASTLFAPDVALWTRDKRLCRVAERLGVLAPLA